MKRYWIWMIPILAAASAILIQAALHGYDPGALSRKPAAPFAQHDTTEGPTFSPVYPENAVKSPPRPAAPAH
jgi:hypothetical protein